MCTLGIAVVAVLLLPACSTSPQKRGGGYYKDDGPGSVSSVELSKIPDAKPHAEPLRDRNNKPYTVNRKTYTPGTRVEPFRQSGIASWYGRRFHGRPTASGEKYNMYAMTAAHPTLPIPSYVRVTSLENGRSVVVRINDRGPFLHGRIIDLSYAAAGKLGYTSKGSARVEVEQIIPGSETPVREPGPIPDEATPQPIAASEARSEDMVSATPLTNDGMEATNAYRAESTSEPYQEVPETGTAQGSNAVLSGVFLQLGAFISRENAESFQSHVSSKLGSSTVKTEMLVEGGYFRICTGPYASSSEARAAAEWIEDRTGIQPFIIRRD